MNPVHQYIKNLIALVFATFIALLIINILGPLYFPSAGETGIYVIALSVAFLFLSFLNYRITGDKPPYLYGLQRSDEYLERKGGFWLLFKWIFNLFGFIYDILVWILHGIYVLFLIIIDLMVFIKMIIYWIVRAVLWFLGLFVPPLVFLYQNFIYYIIRWPWWIYKLTFRNAGISVNRNFYQIALWGSVLGLFIFLLFLGVGLLMEFTVVTVFGAAFALIPLIWSYAEISAIRLEGREQDTYHSVRMQFERGFDAVRAVLFYLLAFLILLIIEILLNLLGWIPSVGLTLLGISLNINTFISLILIFIFVILLFSKFIMPAHVVYDPGHRSNVSSSVRFLGAIGQKFLRYLFAHIPAAFFSAVLAVIPAIVVGIALFSTLQLKNSIIESRISTLNSQLYIAEEENKFDLENRINRLQYYRDFPQLVFGDFIGLEERIIRRDNLIANLSAAENQLQKYESDFYSEIDSMENLLNSTEFLRDSISITHRLMLENNLEKRREDYKTWKSNRNMDIARLRSDLTYEKSMIIQLPFAFLLSILWVAFFGGLVLAVIISYLGNIYHELYGLKEDNTSPFFRKEVERLNKKDRNQPLLGFTLTFIIVILLILQWRYNIFTEIMAGIF